MRGSKTSKNVIFHAFSIFWKFWHFWKNLKIKKSHEIAFWSNIWGPLDLSEVILDVKTLRSWEKLYFINRVGFLTAGDGYASKEVYTIIFHVFLPKIHNSVCKRPLDKCPHQKWSARQALSDAGYQSQKKRHFSTHFRHFQKYVSFFKNKKSQKNHENYIKCLNALERSRNA